MKVIEKKRKTAETEVSVKISDSNEIIINTGIGFFDHMLKLLAFHGNLGLEILAQGDLDTGMHHTVEDIGIVLGQALAELWQGKKGFNRYGHILLPMDEALLAIACDISGRPFLSLQCNFLTPIIAGFPVELVEEFFRALTYNAKLTLHIYQLAGVNTHHIIEAIFKGCGRVLKQCFDGDEELIPSTKGVL